MIAALKFSKAWADKQSLDFRRELRLKFYEPLPPKGLAEHLSISVLTPDDIPDLPNECKRKIFGSGYNAWSGVLIKPNGVHKIIINSKHSPLRINSTIMHELSHVICEHDFSLLKPQNGFPLLREFPKKEEDEANWVAGCLLIPRDGLLWAAKRRMDFANISEHFQTSVDMVRFRVNVTGIIQQLKYMKRDYSFLK